MDVSNYTQVCSVELDEMARFRELPLLYDSDEERISETEERQQPHLPHHQQEEEELELALSHSDRETEEGRIEVEDDLEGQHDAYQALCSETPVHDFDSVAVLNAWMRLQRKELYYPRAVLGIVFRFLSFFLEYAALVALFTPTQNMEYFYAVLLCLVSVVATGIIYVLLLDIKPWNLEHIPRTRTEIHRIIIKIVFFFKPFRQTRAFLYYRPRKVYILGREFIHGETVTKDQLNIVTKINMKGLLDARDDLYEVFLQGIPMALLQYHFLVNTNPSNVYCVMKDAWRVILIGLYIVNSVKCSLVYEWNKRIYQNDLHVREYLTTNGKYQVPEIDLNPCSFFLLGLCHLTSICARFYMISFASGIHWGLGLATFGLLFCCTWFTQAICPAAMATVENLPDGLTVPACHFVDLFINTFTAKDTRYNELSRKLFSVFTKFDIKLPLVFLQLFTFVLPYFFVYSFVKVFKDKLVPTIVEAAKTPFDCATVENTGLEKAILHFFEIIMSWSSSTFKMKFNSPKDFMEGTHLHWLFFYAHIAFACLYTFYVNRCVRRDDDNYPVKLACSYINVILEKIQEKVMVDPENPDGTLHKKMVKRLLFLISLDLDDFIKFSNSLHGSQPDLHSPAESTKFWDTCITKELNRFDAIRARYRQSRHIPSIEGCPLENELEELKGLMQRDQLSFRVYNYCLRRIDHVLLHEMTSNRIEIILAIFGITTKEATRIVREKMI